MINSVVGNTIAVGEGAGAADEDDGGAATAAVDFRILVVEDNRSSFIGIRLAVVDVVEVDALVPGVSTECAR